MITWNGNGWIRNNLGKKTVKSNTFKRIAMKASGLDSERRLRVIFENSKGKLN